MKKFTLYEFAGILIPGAISLFGISLSIPELKEVLLSDVSFGDFGMFVLLSYAAGQLIQAVGNLLEYIWWKFKGGMPTDWIRTGKHELLVPEQVKELENQIHNKLNIQLPKDLKDLSNSGWYSIVRQVNAYVQNKGNPERVEIFNAYYGLNRGICAALICLAVLTAIFNGYKIAIVLFILSMIALYRMNRFAKNYGRELFVQLLQS